MGVRPPVRVHPAELGRLRRPGVIAAYMEARFGSFEVQLREAQRRLALLSRGVGRLRASLDSTRAELDKRTPPCKQRGERTV